MIEPETTTGNTTETATPRRQQDPEPEQAPEDAQVPSRRRRRGLWASVAVTTVVAVGAVGAVYMGRDDGGTTAEQPSKLPTAKVIRTDMVSTTEADGTLSYSGEHTVLAEGTGRITWLPGTGDVIRRGGRVYGMDGHSVPLFYGSTPFWRDLQKGMSDGYDVLELERNLNALGYGTYLSVDRTYTAATETAVKDWQEDLGATESGVVEPGDVVMQPGGLRVTQVDAVLGGPASGGVLTASGTERRITVDLPVSDQDMAKRGAKVEVKLPGGETTTGRVSSVGKVATAGDTNSQSQTGDGTENATVPVYVALDDQSGAGDLNGGPATVGFASVEHKDVLAVPINALLASADGSYHVKVVNAAGKARSVPVRLGIFENDDVEVKGDLTPGMKVQVPRS